MMMRLVLLAALVLLFSLATRGQDPADLEVPTEVDTAAASEGLEGGGALANEVPCSCDCCNTVNRLPSETVTVTQDNGEKKTLTLKCVPPPPGMENDVCPAKCTPSDADMVLTASKENMDYTRYCMYKCKPVAETPGTMCTRLSTEEIKGTFAMDGNGNANAPVYFPESTSGTAWGGLSTGGSSKEKAEEAMKAAETEAKANSMKAEAKYDIREVISQRLRSEAAADVARAAAQEAAAKEDEMKTKSVAADVAKVQTALATFAGAGQTAEVATAAAAKETEENLAAIRRDVAEANAITQTVAKEAKALAQMEIKKQAGPAAKQEADATVYMAAWDKPEVWPKVLSTKVADLYLKQMVGATFRASEYEGYAKGLLGQAAGTRGKAKGLAPQMNQYFAAGDKIAAKTIKNEIEGLISKANGLEANAAKYWKVADDTQKSIHEYQTAGLKAAAYVGWEFKAYYTPPPSLLQTGVSDMPVPAWTAAPLGFVPPPPAKPVKPVASGASFLQQEVQDGLKPWGA